MQFQTIKEINDGLVSKKFSVEELIKDTFALVNENKVLNCFISLNEGNALARAKKIKVSKDSHLLSGIPIAQKDLFCTKGIKTTCGSKMLENFYPPYSSKVEEALDAAGSICIGKTNMDEFAMGSSNETSFFGNVHNPWKKGFVPGGSSGGAACSVAAGLVPAATGTDTGGSIRQPAALCGLTGIKPTYGRISRWGMIAFASSLDQAGPICRTAEDCSILLDAMTGYDSRDTTSLNLDPTNTYTDLNKPYENLRIGIVDEFSVDALSKESQTLFNESLKVFESLGASIHKISLPNINQSVPTYYVIAPAECSSNLSRYDGVKFGHRSLEAEDLESLYINSRSEGFGDEVKRRILIGTYVLSAGYYDAYYKKAQQVRRLIKNDFEEAFKEVDLIVSPTSPSEAFEFGSKGTQDPTELYLEDLYTISSNLAGLPALSMPHGFVNGLPVGIQLIGNYLEESMILNLANRFQQSTDFHNAKPTFEGF